VIWVQFGGSLENPTATVIVVINSTVFLIHYLYFVAQEHLFGRTVGKRIMKLRTCGASGGNPTWGEALVRNGYLLLAFLIFVPVVNSFGPLLPFMGAMVISLSVNNNEDTFQGWHDRMAGGTFVVWDGSVDA
jgi:uncharacterized RDD family membrane protein YckC